MPEYHRPIEPIPRSERARVVVDTSFSAGRYMNSNPASLAVDVNDTMDESHALRIFKNHPLR